MIKIKELSDGSPLIISSVTDFCDSMGYCEFKIKHFLKGIRPPQTKITIDGTKAHEEEEEYEKEHFKFVPISEEELADFKKDVEFAREAIYTRFFTQIEFGEEKVPILIYGQADKVLRSKGSLIVEDSKFPQNITKYLDKVEPYDDQKLQTLLYLNSSFSETGSLNPKECFKIPHNEKVWVINIKDKNTRESIKIFRGTQTKEAKEFLNQKLRKFALIVLGVLEPEHHQNVRKCRSCRFKECEYKIS
jgi:hypothetical protein